MPASDVPGYVQGFRFNAANYSGGQFADLSGYGSALSTRTGTPVFQTMDGHEGLLLDNTWHGQFWHPNAWQGAVVIVARMERINNGTLNKRLITFDNDGSTGTQGKLSAVIFGGQRRLLMTSVGGDNAGHVILQDATIGAVALSHDQMRGSGHSTLDGITVNTNSTATNSNHGNENAMGSNLEGAYIGSLEGNTGNTTVESDVTIHVFELHFFEGNPLLDAATEVQAFLAELATAYA